MVEKVSGLKYNEEFFAGYSPERINPGDKEHTVHKGSKQAVVAHLRQADGLLSHFSTHASWYKRDSDYLYPTRPASF